MPFDGSGNFSRLYSWQSDRDNGIKILASRMDGECDNFAAGLNVVFFRNGLVPMSGNLNMGQNYILGLGAGSVGALPLRFADDPNSGLYLNGYNKPALVANGVNRIEANTSGVALTGNTTNSGTFASAGAITQAGNQVWHAGNLTPGNYMPIAGGTFAGLVAFGNDVNFNLSKPGTDPLLVLDVNDYYGYNRAANQHVHAVGSSVISTIGAGGQAVTGTLSATGAITQNGQQVWHAGNFTPGNYAALASAPTFTGMVTGAGFGIGVGSFAASRLYQASNHGVVLSGNTGSLNDLYLSSPDGLPIIRVPTGTLNIQTGGTINSTGAITQNGQQVWHAGNFTPGNYAPLANPTFTGNVRAPTFSLDTNAYFQIPAADPLLVMDSGDYYGYSRSGNRHVFAIGSTDYLTVANTGITVNGNITKNGAGIALTRGAGGLSATVTQGTAAPSGGADGDIYLQYV